MKRSLVITPAVTIGGSCKVSKPTNDDVALEPVSEPGCSHSNTPAAAAAATSLADMTDWARDVANPLVDMIMTAFMAIFQTVLDTLPNVITLSGESDVLCERALVTPTEELSELSQGDLDARIGELDNMIGRLADADHQVDFLMEMLGSISHFFIPTNRSI